MSTRTVIVVGVVLLFLAAVTGFCSAETIDSLLQTANVVKVTA